MYVCNGAMLQCTMGLAPSSLIVLPDKRILVSNMPIASIMDFKPIVNIAPFGMCQSLTNPTVASATTAAAGVLTPMPCVPVTVAPWMPGKPDVLLSNQPALMDDCHLLCSWLGDISINVAGQVTTQTG